ncbi:MAG: GNAT family N-acetyltransferase [Gammaproteobacteria bacterium]|nr:GNAT family N-acetyltransferase [Gammaproteobacteria bacterium]
MRLEILHGAQIERRLDALARLRIDVFRDWPYLYQGSLDYERRYLRTYIDCADSLAVIAFAGPLPVAATTSLPLAAAEAEMRAPFEQAGRNLNSIHYFGESVVLRSQRGHGLGVKFFQLREAHACALGQHTCAFCSVERPADHPRKPAGYVPNDAFWGRRGYSRQPELATHFPWLDTGETRPTHKRLVFWTRSLDGVDA